MRDERTAALPQDNQRSIMSKTISVALPQPTNLLGRLLVVIDRVLMASAEAAVRNGDLPYFGL
jgi:hypothetical protein